MKRVVITGMGVVSPVGTGLKKYWDNLCNGVSGAGKITRFDASSFPTQIAAEVKDFDADKFIPKKEQKRMDLYCRYAVAAACMAIQDAGLELDKENRDRIGVVVGSGIGGIETLEEEHRVLLEKGPSRCSPFMIPQMISDMASGMVSILYSLTGPNFGVVSACATGVHSLGVGSYIIKAGDADIMIAGGAEAAITPLSLAGFCAARALSRRNDEPEKASRPFDADRDGFVMAEGAGIIILEELEHAKKRGARIYCELAGVGMTADAYHITAPREDGCGASNAMKLAMLAGRINPSEVDYINAHGTSTKLNDAIETKAIKMALGEDNARRVMVSSTKSMTGHALGAAGAIETIACAMAIISNVVPPTINYEKPDPECDLDYVPNEAREAKVNVCLNNSLGFGGHNACVALKRFVD